VRQELHGPLARLGLSVVTGVLQSLVPATAGNIGSNFLASLYSDLHRGMAPNLRGHKSSYYDHVKVSGSSLDEMDWWFRSLQTGLARKSQPSDSKVFSIHFGDGSGTGTGGTGVFYDRPSSRPWVKRLEILHLEVIHVPGKVIIDEGADGLSRGVWNTPLQVPRTFPVAELFTPFVPGPDIIRWAYAPGRSLQATRCPRLR
jgi:hypothetical protein